MPSPSLITQLNALAEVAQLSGAVAHDIAAIHRRPAALRAGEAIAAQSALRGAQCTAAITADVPLGAIAQLPPDQLAAAAPRQAGATPTKEGDAAKPPAAAVAFGRSVRAYSELTHPAVARAERTMCTAPLQQWALLSRAAGGTGRPVRGEAELVGLAAMITAAPSHPLTPVAVQAALAAGGYFGPATLAVACVSGRLLARAGGLDPIGVAVPEVGLSRRRGELRSAALLGSAPLETPEQWRQSLLWWLRAWQLGAEEGAAIVAAAG